MSTSLALSLSPLLLCLLGFTAFVGRLRRDDAKGRHIFTFSGYLFLLFGFGGLLGSIYTNIQSYNENIDRKQQINNIQTTVSSLKTANVELFVNKVAVEYLNNDDEDKLASGALLLNYINQSGNNLLRATAIKTLEANGITMENLRGTEVTAMVFKCKQKRIDLLEKEAKEAGEERCGIMCGNPVDPKQWRKHGFPCSELPLVAGPEEVEFYCTGPLK